MDSNEFRKHGKEMVDFIADYLDSVDKRHVYPDVEPGFLLKNLPQSAPERGQEWSEIFKDVENLIMPSLCHWQSPHLHAWYPSVTSFPSIMGELLSGAIGGVGFTWECQPVATELEMMVLDWIGKMINLPDEFLSGAGKREDGEIGGGVIQASASECILVSMLAARQKAINKLRALNINDNDERDVELLPKLVAYASDQSHSSVEKAALICMVKLRQLPTNKKGELEADALEEAIKEDIEAGRFPFYLCATAGTTPTCSFDHLEELGPVCKSAGVWMHIDAAYAGSAFVCPEFRPLLDGVEFSQSVNLNVTKLMLTNYDCSLMWVKNRETLRQAFEVHRTYYTDKSNDEPLVTDYRHWHIPLGRRFRALKLWFVLRSYGVEGIQNHVRETVRLAKMLEKLVIEDERFELVNEAIIGLVCFRLKGPDNCTLRLYTDINKSGKCSCLKETSKVT